MVAMTRVLQAKGTEVQPKEAASCEVSVFGACRRARGDTEVSVGRQGIARQSSHSP